MSAMIFLTQAFFKAFAISAIVAQVDTTSSTIIIFFHCIF